MFPTRLLVLLLAATPFLAGCVAIQPEDLTQADAPPLVVAATPIPRSESVTTRAQTPDLPAACRNPEDAAVFVRGGSIATASIDAPVRLQAPASVALPRSYIPLPLREDAALARGVREILGADAGFYAVVIKDIATGRGASLNADKTFYAASMFKLLVMYEVFHQESLGLLSLQDQLVMTPYYDNFGLGPRRTKLCQRLTVSEALQAMMSLSDNGAAILLQDLVGAGNLNRSVAALGLTQSRLLPEDLPLTAADVALLLEAIGRGQAVDREASQRMLNLLQAEEFDNGIRAGVPKGVAVAHKTGNWTNATHDAGLVYARSGPYEIVVLTDRAYETRITQELARLSYQYFEGTR